MNRRDPGLKGHAEEAGAQRVTPMMAQYIEIKAANPDCLLFYRMGDFYELFFGDAEIASRALGIVLTRRGKHDGNDIPMCGVPVERADDYLQRLIAAGHRVAVCEQLEDPAEARKRGGKSVVRRDVTRLVTPGTVTEERLLEPARSSLLVALSRTRAGEAAWCYGVAAIDITTGRFTVTETDEGGLAATLARLEPKEVLAPQPIHEDAALAALWRDARAAVTPLPRDEADAGSAGKRLLAFYGVRDLGGFGAFSRAEVAAAGLALGYVERTQRGQRPSLSPPVREQRGALMEIDAATRANLELTRRQSGEREGSLLATIDRTVTAAGGRLLAERLAGPLLDPLAIAARQESIAFFCRDADGRAHVRAVLSGAPDLLRALGRLALDRGGPRDLTAVGEAVAAALALAEALASADDAGPELAEVLLALSSAPGALATQLADALHDPPPLLKREGGFVREGHDAGLDETRRLSSETRRVVAELQGRYVAETDCRTLRVKHNNQLGYFIEVPQAAGERLLKPPHGATFMHRQTMAGAMRFSTAELADLESRIVSAGDRALGMELAIFARLQEAVLAEAETLKRVAEALAVLDVSAALADLAAQRGWTRPVVDDSLDFGVEGARHPVVEAALAAEGHAFVANDCVLSPPEDEAAGRILLVTGPNMAGKSTFLRQNALVAVLAQMGSFVPARHAKLGVVDRLFSRVGAADDLARGRSTFMVEMVETAAILNQAGERALVILDEIGRGTATFDGLSIAWAAIEHLHDVNRARALFATHFHELTALAKRLPRLANITMRVTDWEGEVVFLHEVVAGAADRSYGIQVAKLAGLPPPVLERARTILAELERAERARPPEARLDDLPLFSRLSVAPAPPSASTPAPVPAMDALRLALSAIQPDELTPREALEALYRLKSLERP